MSETTLLKPVETAPEDGWLVQQLKDASADEALSVHIRALLMTAEYRIRAYDKAEDEVTP